MTFFVTYKLIRTILAVFSYENSACTYIVIIVSQQANQSTEYTNYDINCSQLHINNVLIKWLYNNRRCQYYNQIINYA